MQNKSKRMYRALDAIKDRDKDQRLRFVGCQLSRMLVVVDLESFSFNGSLAAGLLTKLANRNLTLVAHENP